MWRGSQIMMHDRSDTMEACDVILTTIKKRDKTVMTTTHLSACSARRGTTTRLTESMKTSSPTEKTITSSAHDLGEHAEGHQQHPAHRATWEHGRDQCSQSSERHPRQRKGHTVPAPWYPAAQTRTTLPPPADRMGSHSGESTHPRYLQSRRGYREQSQRNVSWIQEKKPQEHQTAPYLYLPQHLLKWIWAEDTKNCQSLLTRDQHDCQKRKLKNCMPFWPGSFPGVWTRYPLKLLELKQQLTQ